MNTELKIKEIMTVNLVSIKEWTSLPKVLELFNASTIHHLLVTNKEGKLVGIVSKEDLLKFYYSTDIFYANQFRALPVVEIDELLGIITPYDLLKYAYSEVQGSREEPRPMSQ